MSELYEIKSLKDIIKIEQWNINSINYSGSNIKLKIENYDDNMEEVWLNIKRKMEIEKKIYIYILPSLKLAEYLLINKQEVKIEGKNLNYRENVKKLYSHEYIVIECLDGLLNISKIIMKRCKRYLIWENKTIKSIYFNRNIYFSFSFTKKEMIKFVNYTINGNILKMTKEEIIKIYRIVDYLEYEY